MAETIVVERTQTGVRIEKRMVKVLKGLAEYHDISMGDLLEGIVLHAFESRPPFGDDTLVRVRKLKDLYGMDYGVEAAHRFREAGAPAEEPATAEDFAPAHVLRSATIRLDAPPERVFPLFTPLGERAWVPGWEPRFVWPADGEARTGAVFTTRARGEPETIWTIAHHDAERFHVVYARTTPGVRAGRVEVRCTPAGDGRTEAEVTYTFTGLSQRGNDLLTALTEDGYRRFIGGWQTAINAYLAGASGE